MIRPLEWDSQHFQCRIGRVEGDVPEVSPDFDCLYFLAAAGNRAAHQQARHAGFVEIGDRVHLLSAQPEVRSPESEVRMKTTSTDAAAAKTPGSVFIVRPCAGIRAARLTDLDSLAAIEFPDSRFARDLHFPRERVAALYRCWIRKLIESTFVATDGDGTAGYVACEEEDHRMRISLIGVAKEFRGCGMAGALLSAASLYASQRGLAELIVTTQGCNQAALGLYHRHGFRELSRETWFHWWRV